MEDGPAGIAESIENNALPCFFAIRRFAVTLTGQWITHRMVIGIWNMKHISAMLGVVWNFLKLSCSFIA